MTDGGMCFGSGCQDLGVWLGSATYLLESSSFLLENVVGPCVCGMTEVGFGASLARAPFWSRSLGGGRTPGSVRRARHCRLVRTSGVLTPLFDGHGCPLSWTGSQSLWAQDWPSGLRPQRCLCPRGCGEWADSGSLFCDFCFGETTPQPSCDCPPGCCGVTPTGSPWWPSYPRPDPDERVMPTAAVVAGSMWRGTPALAEGLLWTPESPVLDDVLRCSDRAHGGAFFAASRAVSGARSRVTYVLVRPSSSRSQAAFRWPLVKVTEEVLRSTAARHSPRDDDLPCRTLAIGVWALDLDTSLAPQFLPGWLRPILRPAPAQSGTALPLSVDEEGGPSPSCAPPDLLALCPRTGAAGGRGVCLQDLRDDVERWGLRGPCSSLSRDDGLDERQRNPQMEEPVSSRYALVQTEYLALVGAWWRQFGPVAAGCA